MHCCWPGRAAVSVLVPGRCWRRGRRRRVCPVIYTHLSIATGEALRWRLGRYCTLCRDNTEACPHDVPRGAWVQAPRQS